MGDRTTPDISQLPALANFFNVTTDQLLGVDIYKRNEAIGSILEYDQKTFGPVGDMEGSIEYLTEKLREYPTSHELIRGLVGSLYSKYFQSSEEFSEETKSRRLGRYLSYATRASNMRERTSGR